jgi:hypothetical protein
LPDPFFRADLSPDDHAAGVIVLPLPDTGRGEKTPWRTRVAERSCTARELAFASVKKRTTPSYQRFSAYRCGALPAPPRVGEGREISAEAEISGERSAQRTKSAILRHLKRRGAWSESLCRAAHCTTGLDSFGKSRPPIFLTQAKRPLAAGVQRPRLPV